MANSARPPYRSASRPPNSSNPLKESPYATLTVKRPEGSSRNSRPISGSGTAIKVIVKIKVL
ncbi:hypothetical protein [Streptosporangium lutulentum]|uniref:hypothetical protein n=1 Tax=Streptosporangium lutulentum TaxID=1461250 RepID=UPI003627E1F3